MPYLDLHVHISDVAEVGRTLSDCFDTVEEHAKFITRQDDLKTKSSSLSGDILYQDVEHIHKYLSDNKIPFWFYVYKSKATAEGGIYKGWFIPGTSEYKHDYWYSDYREVAARELFELKDDPEKLATFIEEKTFRFEMPDFITQKKLQALAKTKNLLLNQS